METIPIPLTDLIAPIPNIRTRTFFIVNDCLDVDALRNALTDLIRNHWRKLGARVVRGTKNGQWAEASIDTVTESLKRPSPNSGIAFLQPINHVDSCFRPADWPFEQKDDPADAPILNVHVRTFTDATVIAISMLHVFGDQLGLANIVKAWMGILEGKAPPPFLGHDEEVLPHDKAFADFPKRDTYRKGRVRVRRFGEYAFVIIGFILDLILHAEESHIIFFPLKITGILTKFSLMSRTSPVTISLAQTVNLRGRVPQLLSPARDGFIHNALTYATSRYRHSRSTSVGEIAYLNRQAVNEALTPEEIDVRLAVMREMVKRGQSMHICEPFEKSYSVTNWCGAWKGVDFTNAAKRGEKQGGETRQLDMLVLGHGGERKTPKRFHSTVMCKTSDGYWVDFSTSRKGMKAIKDYIASDPALERF
ncbi:Acetyltransferase adrJ like protein [Verticillium longisporum]|uniref:Acetyltransferase adrJ like protein n=1 Tax=Verticillium longisporum TaxID=100787 RepID=A0A8I2ZEX8_VERLO|nr:Acetyltransferase adrJ like protein [Verticillium longisporum]